MKTEKVKITEINGNKSNPRIIKDDKFKKLVQSIKDFPQMLEIRPIVVDEENVVLGGNMRLKACIEAGLKEVFIIRANELTDEQKQEFIIKDNVGFGEWDWDQLANEWDAEKLNDWGLDVPLISETEKLSKVEFEDVYYIPENKPNILLIDCVDLTKFNQKLEIINKSNLTEDQKKTLTFFAYRFIKIDFENVANYYFFNANEDEKEIIERLRLVLCDNGINGFIEDDLLRVHNLINGWND
jgi:hypothetical protein